MLLCDDPRVSREGLLLSCNATITVLFARALNRRQDSGIERHSWDSSIGQPAWKADGYTYRPVLVEIFSRDTFGSFTRAVQRTTSVKRSIDTIKLLQVHFFLKNFFRRKTLKTLSLIQFVFSKSKGSILPEEYYFHTFFISHSEQKNCILDIWVIGVKKQVCKFKVTKKE